MKTTISYSSLPKILYLKPETLEETLELLNEHQDNGKILAGGTDLLIELRQRLKIFKVIIDVKDIPELREIRITDSELSIGAAVPIMEILTIPIVQTHFLALYESLKDLADELIRYRATIGGNIGNASPAADSAAPLYVFDAKVHISSLQKGSQIIPVRDFFTGVKINCLEPDELITKITIPIPTENTRSAFRKMKRSSEDLAVVGVAGCCNDSKTYLSYISIAPTPIFIDISDRIPKEIESPIDIDFGKLWDFVKSHLKPIDDLRASKSFRMHIAELLTLTILKEIV